MKKLFITLTLVLAFVCGKAQTTTFYDVVKSALDDYYTHLRTNKKLADQDMIKLVAYGAIVGMYAIEHGQSEAAHLSSLESLLESFSRTTLATPAIEYSATIDNEFVTILVDSISMDGGVTYKSYILDSAAVQAIAAALDAAYSLDSAGVKSLAIDTSGVHSYDSLTTNKLNITTNPSAEINMKTDTYDANDWLIIKETSGARDSVKICFLTNGFRILSGSAGATLGFDIITTGNGCVGLVAGASSHGIVWDGDSLYTAYDTVAYLSNLRTHTSNISNPHSVTKTQVGLSSVTNDAQLKREAGDINTFTAKSTPSNTDILLIEDSDASYAKKKVLWSSLPVTEQTIKEYAVDTTENHSFSSISSDTLNNYSFIKIGQGQDSLYYIDVDHQLGNYNNACVFGDYILVTSGIYGLRSYSVDRDGYLTYVDEDDQGGDYFDVCADDSFIYVTRGLNGILSYSIDVDGELTYIDGDAQGGQYFYICADDSFIYVSCYTTGLKSYSSVDGILTYIDSDLQGTGPYMDVCTDSTYVYVCCSGDGLRSYLTYDGTLTATDVDDQGGTYQGIAKDGCFIYIAAIASGLYSYSASAGTLTFIHSDDQGGNYNAVVAYNGYIYVVNSTGAMDYSVDRDGALTFIELDERYIDLGAVETDNDFLYFSCYNSGLRTATTLGYTYVGDDYIYLNPQQHLPPNPKKGLILVDIEGNVLAYNGATYDTLSGGGGGGGSGTVTSVAAGNGMNFTTITTSGSVTMGTPSSVTSSSTNSVSAGTHTHALDNTAVTPGSYTNTNLTVDAKGRITAAANGTGGGSESKSFFCTGDSIAEVADSVGYYVITADMAGMNLVDMQVRSFNNADRVVHVDVYRIRSATIALMTSTEATLGAEYTVSDEVIDTGNDDVLAGDLIYVRWYQDGGTTRHFGLFVGLDFELP